MYWWSANAKIKRRERAARKDGRKMKLKIKHGLLAVACIVLLVCVSCTTKTEYGKCIGLADDKDPALIYKVSANNLFWGIVGLELIYPPIKVAVDCTFCPVGRK